MKYLLIIIMSTFVHAKEIDFEKSISPKSFKDINWSIETDLGKYKKVLGKADYQKDNYLYYKVDKLKYPISLETNKNKVTKVFFRVLGNKPNFNQAKDFLKTNNFVEEKSKNTEYKTFTSEEKKLKLRFSAITKKLYSVEKWF